MAESKDIVNKVSFSDSSSGASAGETEPFDPREAEIQRKLEQLNKPAVKSIVCPDGKIIDCVPIMEQPAFDNPLLKDHAIQMKPSSCPKGLSKEEEGEAPSIPDNVQQTWNKYGECPEGTIPIIRTTREDLLRADSIENYGKKSPNYTLPGHSHTE